jgi:outer membrane protein assembly factor BamB
MDLSGSDTSDAEILCPDGFIAIDDPCEKEIECINDKEYRKQKTTWCGEIFNPQCCTGGQCDILGTFSCDKDEKCVKINEYGKNDECQIITECPSGNEGDILFSFKADSPVVSTPAIGPDGTIYFGTIKGTFYAIDCKGNKKWEWSKGGCNNSYNNSPAIGIDGTIYIGGDYNMYCSDLAFFYALTPDGKPFWKGDKLPVQMDNTLSPVIADSGTVYVTGNQSLAGGSPGKVFALNAAGEILNGFPVTALTISGSPAGSDDVLFVGQTSVKNDLSYSAVNSIFAINKKAQILWTEQLSSVSEVPQPLSLSSLAVDKEGKIFAAENYGSYGDANAFSILIELDPSTGKKIWEVQVSSKAVAAGSPVIGSAKFGEDVIVALSDGHLVSANPYSGGAMITFDTAVNEYTGFFGSPVLGDDDNIYAVGDLFTDVPRFYMAKVSKQGKVLQSYIYMGAEAPQSPAMGNGGVLYVGTNGGLFAIQSGAKGLDKSAPWPLFRHDEKNTGNAGEKPLECSSYVLGYQCPDETYFCEYPEGTCTENDITGTCVKIPSDPSDCPDYDICPYVCSCDDKTYCDDCERHLAKVSKKTRRQMQGRQTMQSQKGDHAF